MNSIALITGSTRGIGFEVARQLAERDFTVIITGRTDRAVKAAAGKIGASAVAHILDTSDASSIADLAAWVRGGIGRLDVLVNNAAILVDDGESILDTKAETFEATMRVNALGPLLMTQAVAPLLRGSKAARVVNVSSGAGQISSMTTYAPAYSISKATLNATTVMLAAGLPSARRNGAAPGRVRTAR